LLARLGLRAGDIVQLRLGDLDWREGMICVSGKGRRQAVLPLTQEAPDVNPDDHQGVEISRSALRRMVRTSPFRIYRQKKEK
jgi:integrase